MRKDVNAFDEAIRIWSGPTEYPESGTKGYDRIVDQAGIQYTWEWILIDPSRPWASAVPSAIRERIEADLERRDKNAVARAKARAQEAECRAEEKDDEVIAWINADRAKKGQEPLTPQQEASVRENRRRKRAEPSTSGGSKAGA